MDNNTNCIGENWSVIIKEYNKLLRRHLLIKNYNSNLNKGVTDEQIKKAEELIGCSFPSELAELYKYNNGNLTSEKENVYLGAILGLQFISLEVLLCEWRDWCEFTNEKALDEYCTSINKHTVKCLYANDHWIPFASDGCGNHIGIDLDPDINGTVGQVINFGSNENDKIVFARSLNEFLELMIKIIRSEEFRLVKKRGQQAKFYLGTTDKGIHAIDYLKKIIINK